MNRKLSALIISGVSIFSLNISVSAETAEESGSTTTLSENTVSNETKLAEKPANEKKKDKPVKEKKVKETKVKETKVSSDNKSKDKSASGAPDIATRLASFTTGCLVGVPVSMVRRTGSEIVQGNKDLLGDTDNWFFMVPASIITVPFGAVSGGFGGVIFGIKNAWTGSGDEPFGKDSFSLGEM